MCACVSVTGSSQSQDVLPTREGRSFSGMTPLELNDRKSSFRQTDSATVRPSLNTHTHTHTRAGKGKRGYAFVCVRGDGSLFAPHALSPFCWMVSFSKERTK